MPSVPPFSPIIIDHLVCPNCGEQLKHRLTRLANGKVTGIEYFCLTQPSELNPRGCLYKSTGSLHYANAQQELISEKDLTAILVEFGVPGTTGKEVVTVPASQPQKAPPQLHHGMRTDPQSAKEAEKNTVRD